MEKTKKKRSGLLDSIRGCTVIQMVLYHAVWDLVFIFGVDWKWYQGTGAYIWQQCICCTFILLSGFCSAVSRHPVKRGLTVFGIGGAVTLVTALFMPDEIVLFGVLTLIGSCMLLLALLRKPLSHVPPVSGAALSLLLFLFTRHVDMGYLGFFGKELIRLPRFLYASLATAYFGFCPPGFYSTDYFALLPWFFLFLTGFFLYGCIGKAVFSISWKGIRPLNFIGRHALEVYVVHQPVIYGALLLWDAFLR